MKVLMVSILMTMVAGCSVGRSGHIGVHEGKLSQCPESPNCVASQSQDVKHYINPIPYKGDREQARKRMVSIIQGMKRAKIVALKDDYIHAEFTSAIFRFVDDVEIYFDDGSKTIHMRSASRIGYSDFGVNRKRLENIRTNYIAMSSS
ncbi:MAG: DUF1499 domain-containing protein [Syntrophales bacterium]